MFLTVPAIMALIMPGLHHAPMEHPARMRVQLGPKQEKTKRGIVTLQVNQSALATSIIEKSSEPRRMVKN